MNNYDIDEIVDAFHFIRNNKEAKNYVIDNEDKALTEGGLCTMGDGWRPGCVFLFFILAFAIFAIFMAIFIDLFKCMLSNTSN